MLIVLDKNLYILAAKLGKIAETGDFGCVLN